MRNPLISCLCVTRGKPLLLQRAIKCYMAQTYSNKELIIVFESDDLETINFLKSINTSDIRKFEVRRSPNINLGQLRNIAISYASGEYVCQWDDDDWFHSGRLEFQYEVIKETGFKGSILTRWIVYNSLSATAYVSNKRLWEGSVMCKKSIMQDKVYENEKMGEDTPVIEYLYSMKYLFPINNAPNLYIYVYHGENTWNYEHWNLVFQLSEEFKSKDSKQIKNILAEKIPEVEASICIDQILNNPLFDVD